MKLLVKLLRVGLGSIIAFISWLTLPRKLKRSPEAQATVNSELNNLALYQFFACPFCIKTRRTLHRLNLPMQLRDTQAGSPHRDELAQGGGRVKVPCLRIDEGDGDIRWMYESSDIIAYLESRFG
ncbi:glutathione S-transferase N-terminal domain-containing protein [Gilvimarinus agarilyticus]|uniref:glutathione S-transferase N-terminal domain-containing protein n=1 Tax=unclassified Gilvimarinus TaxID=2642066 RepID=UPI001C09E7AC|nr:MULTISPECIES: glutathione S-transferase N-terminal domain-containing protein [unclassified Gilvimarinus]MBU2887444.1 glutathione S-transferase N-terminal domain-containing protein [Gilvimarinus agarilyticus]MDO6572103.1 glutathione S-transferase N-terminal domain-containing protein [Gilvimarinus sp. 2_MG-2023]MDO6746164.1 glutathione S-transferase N-terminal domain-containing protein [Gilvimarinus sp. 1_MG-2023]